MIFDESPASGTPRGGRVKSARVPKPIPEQRAQTKRKSGPKAASGINLRAVAEVLESYGLDPTVEFAKVLQIEGALEPEVRARMLLEIMQYVHPKLKSVELTQDKPMQMVVRWATADE